MNFIDTHAHVNLKAFSHDAKEVLERCLENGVGVINVGTDITTSRQAIEIMRDFPEGVFAVVGLHPSHTYENPYLDENESEHSIGKEIFYYEAYKQLAVQEKVVGVGECGLDYYRLPSDVIPAPCPPVPGFGGREAGIQAHKDMDSGLLALGKTSLVETGMTERSNLDPIELIKTQQKQAFLQQILLAQELNKALVIHCRPSQGTTDAYEDVLSILKTETRNSKLETPRFEVHSFTGDWQTAEKFLELGGYLGINGILTFDKTGVLAEVVKNTPLERILLETDSPYLAPAPNRGKRNEPINVKIVAQKIAELKNLSVEEVAEQTTKNAKKLFRI